MGWSIAAASNLNALTNIPRLFSHPPRILCSRFAIFNKKSRGSPALVLLPDIFGERALPASNSDAFLPHDTNTQLRVVATVSLSLERGVDGSFLAPDPTRPTPQRSRGVDFYQYQKCALPKSEFI